MEHTFTVNIKGVLQKYFAKNADEIFEKSLLIQYINEKTRSATSGSKARSSFNSLYSIYTIIEDYLANNFDKAGDYSKYEGAMFSKLLKRARDLPFGSKIQNHSFNIGRFFQVTETLDFKKYFLDIEKIERYPITFVIKSDESAGELIKKIKEHAIKLYSIKAIVDKYMSCIEEVINIPILTERFLAASNQGYLNAILEEIIKQSKVEFHYDDDDED